MKVLINPAIFEKFPGARIAYVVAKLPRQFDQSADQYVGVVRQQLPAKCEQVGLTKEGYRQDPNIKIWRDAYQTMGNKPKTFPPSVDALTGRVLKGDMWNLISPTVDLYNCVSVNHKYPMGAYDLASIQGDIRLDYGREGEIFFPLGRVNIKGQPLDRFPVSKETVVYRDDQRAICWSWNYRDSRFTPITNNTRYGIYFLDSLYTDKDEELIAARDELAHHFHQIGCEVLSHGLVSSEEPEVSIDLSQLVSSEDREAFEQAKKKHHDEYNAFVNPNAGKQAAAIADLNVHAQQQKYASAAASKLQSALCAPNPHADRRYLFNAVATGDFSGFVQSTDQVLEKEIRALYNTPGADGIYLIHHAATGRQMDSLRRLMRFKVDVNVQTPQGATPLHCGLSSPEVVSFLLNHGADPNVADGEGLTSLLLAVKMKYPPEVVGALLSGTNTKVDLSVTDKNGRTAMEIAQDSGSSEVVELLQDYSQRASVNP